MEGISPSVLPTPMYNSASSQPSSSLNRLSKYLRTSSSYLRFWHSDKSQSSVELISRIGICALIVTFTHEGTKTSKLHCGCASVRSHDGVDENSVNRLVMSHNAAFVPDFAPPHSGTPPVHRAHPYSSRKFWPFY
eukprot:756207-Pyramimonas_sp.AAC.1